MCIEIEKEGIFSSIQGLGCYGFQRFGINPRGAMDRTAVRILNVLVGNPQELLAMELHFPAGEIRFTEQCTFALGGADFGAEMEGHAVDCWRTHVALPDQRLRFKKKVRGNRCYLAVNGGLTTRPGDQLSRASELTTRRLVKGDSVRREFDALKADNGRKGSRVSSSILPPYSHSPTVRFIPGPEFERLDNGGLLSGAAFTVSPNSDRMGFRLQGPALALADPVELVSSSVNFGTMQLLPDGQIVVLMADHQTSGGYPRIGNIISADLPLIGQLGPGDKVTFSQTNVDEAETAVFKLHGDLRKLELGISFGRYA